MNTRNWSIRSKIIALVAVPMAALLALWIFATTLTARPGAEPALRADAARRRRPARRGAGRRAAAASAGCPLCTWPAGASCRRARRAAHAHRPGGRRLPPPAAGRARDASDLLAAAARPALHRRSTCCPPAAASSTGARSTGPARSGLYNGMIDAAFRRSRRWPRCPTRSSTGEARAITALGRAREVLAQSDALLAGAFTAGPVRPGRARPARADHRHPAVPLASAVADLPDAGTGRLPAARPRARRSPGCARMQDDADRAGPHRRGRPGRRGQPGSSAYDAAASRACATSSSTPPTRWPTAAPPVAVGILVRLGARRRRSA